MKKLVWKSFEMGFLQKSASLTFWKQFLFLFPFHRIEKRNLFRSKVERPTTLLREPEQALETG